MNIGKKDWNEWCKKKAPSDSVRGEIVEDSKDSSKWPHKMLIEADNIAANCDFSQTHVHNLHKRRRKKKRTANRQRRRPILHGEFVKKVILNHMVFGSGIWNEKNGSMCFFFWLEYKCVTLICNLSNGSTKSCSTQIFLYACDEQLVSKPLTTPLLTHRHWTVASMKQRGCNNCKRMRKRKKKADPARECVECKNACI